MNGRFESFKVKGSNSLVFAFFISLAALCFGGCNFAPDEAGIVIARLGKAGAATGSVIEPGREQGKATGREITLDRLNSALTALLPGGTEELTEPELTELKHSLLNEIIEEELVLGEAGRLGLTISAEEGAREEQLLRENLDDDAFFSAVIPRYGSLEKWKEEIGRNLLIRKVLREIVSSKEPASEKEARKYYDDNRAEYDIPEQVRASMIVVESAPKAEAALSRLSTEEFSTVAKELSTGPEALQGGDLGFFGRGDMPQEFEEAVFSLKAGETSTVVMSPYGFHVFNVVARNDGRKLKFEDVAEEIKEILKREREDEYYRQWMQELKKNTEITIMREF